MVHVGSPALVLDRLHKSYGGVQALHEMSLTLSTGEVHALCGENGAGKSTLIKCLTGVVQPDGGALTLDGIRLPEGDVRSAERAGIVAIHQESTIFPDLNAVDNIFVGREFMRKGWLVDRRRMRQATHALLERLELPIPLDEPVGNLSVGQRKLVSVARALAHSCRILILDEPTAALSAKEATVLKQLVLRLRAQGLGVIYVSHRLEEVFELADRVTVLRDGHHITTCAVGELDRTKLIQLMVGRRVEERSASDRTVSRDAPSVLEVTDLCGQGFRGIHLRVRAGEIVGLAGLVGAGRSELARAMFGIDPITAGTVCVQGKPLVGRSVTAAIAAGLGLVPEDRQHEGLVLPMSVAHNLTLAVLHRFQRWGRIDRRREDSLVARSLNDLHIKTASPHAAVSNLSGGNQQKVVLGKWLACEPRVLILDEPTAGVDVGAKAQVHRLIQSLAGHGVATLLISSDMSELFALSDRIVVMRSGQQVGEFEVAHATPQQVLDAALPVG